MKTKKRALSLAAQLLIAGLAAVGFFLMNVNGGPLVLMDFIGGWSMRRGYLLLCGGVMFAAFAVLALQKRDWATYGITAAALFLGALMRFYMIDVITPYYAEGIAPLMRALENGLSGLEQSDYTPLMALIFRVFEWSGLYPMYWMKLVSIGCDLLIALSLGALLGGRKAKIVAVAYLFCPVFFLYGAYAGAMDAAYVLLVLVSALLLRREKRAAAWTVFGAAWALDPMALAALPMLLWWKGKRRDRALACAPGACVVLSLPALAMGMPLSGALRAMCLAGRNAQAMHMRSSSIYNFFAPVFVKGMPQYHIMEHVEGMDGNALVNDMYTLENMLAMRDGFFIAFVTLFAALLIVVFLHREKLRGCDDALMALFPLVFCMFLPGVDAASFILSDLAMLLYVLRVRGGWKVGGLSLGASAVSAMAFVTGAELVPLWICMAAQLGAMALLGSEVLAALKKSGALGTANAPQRI